MENEEQEIGKYEEMEKALFLETAMSSDVLQAFETMISAGFDINTIEEQAVLEACTKIEETLLFYRNCQSR